MLRPCAAINLPSQPLSSPNLPKAYLCLQYGKGFSHPSNLNLHGLSHSGEKPVERLQCSLSMDRRVHTPDGKPYKCRDCGTGFSQSSHLIIHQRAHAGERPYRCGDCDKSFSSRSYLLTHRRVHTGEKPYCCEVCGKTFSQKTNLLTHWKLHRAHRRLGVTIPRSPARLGAEA
ncbi:zinc finger protein 664-like [Otolemur garnettii]|uniref:zinc finger protein 664-like n=1 Tax=Otolemur garnettii TaxID=30611 RepID=UPI00064429B9|nr:zinc finger protein 664-like [Otolemur garnettii]